MRKHRKTKPEVEVHDLSKLKGTLKLIGGSMSDDWNNVVANQTAKSLWLNPLALTTEESNSTPQ